MIEAHYSAFVVDAMEDLAVKAVVPLLKAGALAPTATPDKLEPRRLAAQG